MKKQTKKPLILMVMKQIRIQTTRKMSIMKKIWTMGRSLSRRWWRTPVRVRAKNRSLFEFD